MPNVSRGLPASPHLDVPKRQARELLSLYQAHPTQALERVSRVHPRFFSGNKAEIATTPFRLADAQMVIAREYGFSTWMDLKRRIEVNSPAQTLENAIRTGDLEQSQQILRDHPHLLHLPVRNATWGPPMSFAANLGRIEIMQAMAGLGARDLQTALERAVLQGEIDCARWLLKQGEAELKPGIVMGPCETLNPAGLRFLVEAGAPLTDGLGNNRAPLALVLETYSRNPAGKHEILNVFADQRHALPDTPVMAFHRGQVDRLKEFLLEDSALIKRQFTYREIYPPELGCRDDGQSGLHGTPLEGATLLHLAIDFDELEIFEFLLEHGADVNAPSARDADGFGGQTPLFHCVVSDAYLCGRQRDAVMARTLLKRGASPETRATLRKFLDWRPRPEWHEAHDVTAAEWGAGFPEHDWVNPEVMRLLGRS